MAPSTTPLCLRGSPSHPHLPTAGKHLDVWLVPEFDMQNIKEHRIQGRPNSSCRPGYERINKLFNKMQLYIKIRNVNPKSYMPEREIEQKSQPMNKTFWRLFFRIESVVWKTAKSNLTQFVDSALSRKALLHASASFNRGTMFIDWSSWKEAFNSWKVTWDWSCEM